MTQFWLALTLVLVSVHSAHAVDLSIYDPVVSDLNISVTASLSASSNYYLQGLLRSESSSKYFGETENGKGGWIDYISSPEKEYVVSNFYLTDVHNSTWSGQIKIRFKLDDPNYLGPGPYDLKLRRFTGNSSNSAGESNSLQINLTVPLPTLTPSPTPDPSVAVSSSPSPTITPIPTPTIKPSISPSPSLASPSIGTVAGVSTDINLSGFGVSPTPPSNPDLPGVSRKGLTLNHDRAKTAILVGSGLILLSIAGFFGYRKYRSVYNQGE